MTQRTKKEMSAILARLDEQIGPLDKWSDEALEGLSDWLKETLAIVEHQWVNRDASSEADC